MPKLNDTHTMLLAHAAARDSGSFYPLAQALTGTARAPKALAALITFGMAEERPITDPAEVGRTDDGQRYGVFVTPAGCAAIGVVSAGEESGATANPPEAIAPANASSKTTAMLALLARAEGATLAELIETTGWLPHTTRAALTGLRKKGHAIVRSKRGEATCYVIPASAA